jgi:hypothetical protein
MDLVRALSEVREGVARRAWDDPRFSFGAIVCPPDSEEATAIAYLLEFNLTGRKRSTIG